MGRTVYPWKEITRLIVFFSFKYAFPHHYLFGAYYVPGIEVVVLNKVESLDFHFMWGETEIISKWQPLRQWPGPQAVRSHWCLCVLPTTWTAFVWRLLWECWDYEGVKKASVQATQPADSKCAYLCSGWGEGVWPDSSGFLASHPRATFFCFIKPSIVFRPVGLSRSYMRSVRYTPWRRGFTEVCVCHGFVPRPPFQNYCWL